jgi:hypothetical protein
MNREVHVRIWERPEVRVLRATRQLSDLLICPNFANDEYEWYHYEWYHPEHRQAYRSRPDATIPNFVEAHTKSRAGLALQRNTPSSVVGDGNRAHPGTSRCTGACPKGWFCPGLRGVQSAWQLSRTAIYDRNGPRAADQSARRSNSAGSWAWADANTSLISLTSEERRTRPHMQGR